MVRINRQEHFVHKLFLVPYYKTCQKVSCFCLCLDLYKSINMQSVTILIGNKELKPRLGRAGWQQTIWNMLFAEYNQQDATFHNLFISVRRSACFRRFFHPSSGVQNWTYSVRYLLEQYCCYLLLSCSIPARLAAGSSIGLTNTWRCMCSFELLMMGGKTVWNM